MIDAPASKDAPWPAVAPPAQPLHADTSADVCVVGAGMAGLCVAYALSKRGRSVVVLDDGPVAGGETRRSTAHLASALDDRLCRLEWVHGEEGARLAAASHAAAINWIEDVARAEGVECGFRRVDGYLVVPPRRLAEREALLDRELKAARRAGLPVDRVDSPPLAGALWGGALRFPGQAQMDPAAFATGLAAAIVGAGGRIHTASHVTTISGGEPCRVETREGRAVSAAHVVVATNTPVNDRVVIHTKQASYRTYAMAFPDLAGEFPAILLWDGKWEDDRAYHYLRGALLSARPGEPPTAHIIVGGEDHKTGQDGDNGSDRFECLAEWARGRFAGLGDATYRWSGQVLEPCDGVAFIGRNPADHANVYIVTGDSGQGITHGAIAGMLIPDLIEGRSHPWASLYDPARKSLRAAGAFVRENVNTAAQYADWVHPGTARSEDEVRRGSGAVILRGFRRIAVHRDDDGVVWRCSAACPHLGGVVRWNGAERTWDCPCHGSRFDARGNS